MAAPELTFQVIFDYFVENGGKVKNRDTVRHFKRYLTDPGTKDANRRFFKEYINTLAHTKLEGDEKVLILKSKYRNASDPISLSTSTTSLSSLSAQNDPRNNVGLPLPVSPLSSIGNLSNCGSTNSLNTLPRQPPPYRNPPPVPSPSPSLDSISLGGMEERPMAPPRRKQTSEDSGRSDSRDELLEDETKLSVKERTQQFNRMASVEDELSPPRATPRSNEKDRSKTWMADDSDESILTPLEPKKCQEWYVTASRGDCQELLKLAKDEPRLVNKKDPFTAYNVLHWGAKYGNPEIIKIFAGRYKVDVNGRTNGGYTPLHIAAQFEHKDVFKLLIEVYKADTNIRDYSGRTAEYYLLSKELKENSAVTLRSEYSNDRGKSDAHGRSVRKSKSTRNKTISFPTTVKGAPLAVNVGDALFQNFPTYPGSSKSK